MTRIYLCNKCKKNMNSQEIRVVDSLGKDNFDLCFDCFGLFGEWLDK